MGLEGEGSGVKGGGKLGERGREVGVGYPPVHPLKGVSWKSKGNLLTDAKSKANVLIKQFVSIFTRDSSNIASKSGKHRNTKTAPQLNIDRKGVLKILKNINIHKAMGPDRIPNILLKTCAEEISYGLSAIFQYSLDTGTLPLNCQNANVTPVFKKGDRHLAENYRPVSFTSVSCKIIEHIICSHICLNILINITF